MDPRALNLMVYWIALLWVLATASAREPAQHRRLHHGSNSITSLRYNRAHRRRSRARIMCMCVHVQHSTFRSRCNQSQHTHDTRTRRFRTIHLFTRLSSDSTLFLSNLFTIIRTIHVHGAHGACLCVDSGRRITISNCAQSSTAAAARAAAATAAYPGRIV